MNQIEIFTDGACSGNPGKGAWAYCIVKDGIIIHESFAVLANTTNNICELLAICNSLDYTTEHYPENKVTLYSDSAYCVNGFNDWIHNWKNNGFLTAKKEPVLNKAIWVELLQYVTNSNIKVVKVPGHANNKYNNYVDKIAREAIGTFGGRR